MFDKMRLIRIMHGGQGFQNVPYNYTDVDGLYTMFYNARKTVPVYAPDDDAELQRDFVRVSLKLATFCIGVFYLSLAMILLKCGVIYMMLLYLISLFGGYFNFRTGFSRMILRYFKNRRILSENSKLFLLDGMDLDPVPAPHFEMGIWEELSSGSMYHILKRIPPLMLWICLWGYLGPSLIPFITNSGSLDLTLNLLSACLKVLLIFTLSFLFAFIILSMDFVNKVSFGERTIPVPQAILAGHSCVNNPENLEMRSYLLMARSLGLVRNTEPLESYPSILPEEEDNPALGEVLIPGILWNNRFVGDMHFNTKVLLEILNLNNGYCVHFEEMGRRMGIKDDDRILYSSESILESLGPGTNRDNLMSVLENDMTKIHILLSMLESNWRNYHRRGNELFVILCGDLEFSDLDSVFTSNPYGEEDEQYESMEIPYFLPEYPNKGREVNFCIDTLMPYQSRRGSTIADNEKDRGRLFNTYN